MVKRESEDTVRCWQSHAHQTSQSHPNLMSSSSVMVLSEGQGNMEVGLLTLEFVFADIDCCRRGCEVGGEFVYHVEGVENVGVACLRKYSTESGRWVSR